MVVIIVRVVVQDLVKHVLQGIIWFKHIAVQISPLICRVKYANLSAIQHFFQIISYAQV